MIEWLHIMYPLMNECLHIIYPLMNEWLHIIYPLMNHHHPYIYILCMIWEYRWWIVCIDKECAVDAASWVDTCAINHLNEESPYPIVNISSYYYSDHCLISSDRLHYYRCSDCLQYPWSYHKCRYCTTRCDWCIWRVTSWSHRQCSDRDR